MFYEVCHFHRHDKNLQRQKFESGFYGHHGHCGQGIKEARDLLRMWKNGIFYWINWYKWRNGVPLGMQMILWSHTLQVLVHPHSKPRKVAAGKEHTERGHLEGSKYFSTHWFLSSPALSV